MAVWYFEWEMPDGRKGEVSNRCSSLSNAFRAAHWNVMRELYPKGKWPESSSRTDVYGLTIRFARKRFGKIFYPPREAPKPDPNYEPIIGERK
jgi:hypothetical protein